MIVACNGDRTPIGSSLVGNGGPAGTGAFAGSGGGAGPHPERYTLVPQ